MVSSNISPCLGALPSSFSCIPCFPLPFCEDLLEKQGLRRWLESFVAGNSNLHWRESLIVVQCFLLWVFFALNFMVCMWRSEENTVEQFVSFPLYLSSGDRVQMARFAQKTPLPAEPTCQLLTLNFSYA